MNVPEAAEQPRHAIVSERVNPAAELTRWLFEHYRISYHEEPHVPFLRVIATRREIGGVAVVGPEGAWMGAREILEGLDAKSRPGQRLYGEGDIERAANRSLVERLLDVLPGRIARYVYAQMLPHKAILCPVITDGAPLWEQAFVYWLYPLWTRLAARRLEMPPGLVAAAPGQIREIFDFMEAELAKRGTRFIGGDNPGIVDIVFAALAAPMVFPARYGATLPALEALPGEFKSFVEQLRARRAGRLVLDTYEAARPQPQAGCPRAAAVVR